VPGHAPQIGSVKNRSRTRFVDYGISFALLTLAIYVGTDLFSPIRFDRERIEVWAQDGQIQVRGIYHYQNRFPFPVSFSFGLPFPVDERYPLPPIFSVSEVRPDGTPFQDIAIRKYHHESLFRLWFAPYQEKWVRVDYVQGAQEENARYILLTTRKWRHSLDSGVYILHLGPGLELDTSNYPLEAAHSESGNDYAFHRSQFFPDRDWLFAWRRAHSLRASASRGTPP
jgi:hypothetical protein